MPDISLLQREYEVMEEERRAPSIALTTAVSVFIVSIGAYAGLYLYNGILTGELAAKQKEMEELRTNDATKALDGLKAFSNKAKALASLRENHRYPSRMFSGIERTAHPAVHFETATIRTEAGSALLHGVIPTAVALARQVDIYARDAATVSAFAVKNIRYGENHAVEFDLEFTMKP